MWKAQVSYIYNIINEKNSKMVKMCLRTFEELSI